MECDAYMMKTVLCIPEYGVCRLNYNVYNEMCCLNNDIMFWAKEIFITITVTQYSFNTRLHSIDAT